MSARGRGLCRSHRARFAVQGDHSPLVSRARLAGARSRQIEFVGDSFTAGYGDLSTSHDCGGRLSRSSNADVSFGALAARRFNADYQINAFSGLKMVRDYGRLHRPEREREVVLDDVPATFTDTVQQIVKERHAPGHDQVRYWYYETSGLDFLGCDWHPSQRDHQVLASRLTDFIDGLNLKSR